MSSTVVKIAPSILAADFARLGEQVVAAERAGADRIHVDVMDGHFVPNISIGPLVVEALTRVTSLPLETHLMISHPDSYLEEFQGKGSTTLQVHVEGTLHLHRTLDKIRKMGIKAGVVINPATPAALIQEVISDVDIVLVMTVNPGFGGQSFIESTLPKIHQVREMIERRNPGCDLEVDGGIDVSTAGRAVEAGANVLVAGSAVFASQWDIAESIARLKDAAQ